MDYADAVGYLESLVDYERTPAAAAAARSFNLERMRRLLARAGDPHRELRCLHIAGTKGKGSTAAMVASVLGAAGCRVGLYTSPHLLSFRERIRVNGRMAPEEAVARWTGRAKPWIESLRRAEGGPPSFFEAYTLLAFLHFREEAVQVAVLETGLGGRLDATNVVTPLACAITRIARDHTLELGETLAQIAGEKAGIVKPAVPVVCAPQAPEALAVIRQVCAEKGAPLYLAGEPGGPRAVLERARPEGQLCRIEGLRRSYRGLTLPLLGEHQLWNAAVAVALAELGGGAGFDVSEQAVREGLASVRWPGRFQVIPGSPPIVLDGAHDEASARALAATLSAHFPGGRHVFLLGLSRDKEAEAIGRELAPLCRLALLTAAATPRALSALELRARVAPLFERCEAADSVQAGLALGKQEAARAGAALVVTGSLYLVGEAMQALGVEVD
jgi:dihydrofolate synthase/folylpolyglutamate synthase